MGYLSLDLHVHTIYSGDSLITPIDLLKMAKLKNLDGFAITDHNSLKAYKILKRNAENYGIIVIPGMEIETDIGEVIGLFIENEIQQKDKDFNSIVEVIKDQGGLVIVPHPFDFTRRNHLKMNRLTNETIKDSLDGIEIMNSRIIFSNSIKKAKKFNQTYNLFETGGSDAHTKKEVGTGYTLVKKLEDSTFESIKKSMLEGNTSSMGELSSPLVHLITVMNKLKNRLYF